MTAKKKSINKKDKPLDAGQPLSNYYDAMIMKALTENPVNFTKPLRYRKVKVPRYIYIKVPVISKYDGYDDNHDYDLRKGVLITLKRVKLFRFGNKIEDVPVYRKAPKNATIKFKRYGSLKNGKKKI